MSKFLAPIHNWLFNKIQISESIENSLLDSLQLQRAPFVTELYARIGSKLPESPLEDLIDQGNIHGWLQNRIHMTESRLAALITWQVKENPEIITELHGIWSESGTALAAAMDVPFPLNAEHAYMLVQDVILEGMPCDRVNQVTAAGEKSYEWLTTSCLHERYFDGVEGDSAHYYALRTSFINGMLGAIQPGTHYHATAQPAGTGSAYHNQINIQ